MVFGGGAAFVVAGIVAGKFGLKYRPAVIFIGFIVRYLLLVSLLGSMVFRNFIVTPEWDLHWWNIASWVYSIAVVSGFFVLFVSLMIMVPSCRRTPDGYLQVNYGNMLHSDYVDADPKLLFFLRFYERDAEHDMKTLEYECDMQFTLVENSEDNIRRYQP